MVSFSAPQRGQFRSLLQCRSVSRLQTGTQSDKACQIKCLIFLEVLRDQALAFRDVVLGSETSVGTVDVSLVIASAYPDWTEYVPDFERAQTNPSGRLVRLSLKLWMSGISSLVTRAWSAVVFQLPVAASIRSLTRELGLKEGPQGVAGRGVVSGIQLSDQTMVLVPVPTDRLSPAFNRG